jgi:L-alanine-DL-glutamate epimerase-like enolase superfamily enzyme
MEYWFGDNPLGNVTIETPLRLEDGMLVVPAGPGFGLTIREDALLRHAV